MPPLRNPRHERFAFELAKGTNQTFAYIAAGYTCASRAAGVNASRLLNDAEHGPRIRARVAEIQQEMEERETRVKQQADAAAVDALALSREWVLKSLIQNAQQCMQGTPVLDSMGNPTGLWRHQPGPLNRALELLGKELGMFKETLITAERADADLETMTPEQQAEELARVAAALGLKRA